MEFTVHYSFEEDGEALSTPEGESLTIEAVLPLLERLQNDGDYIELTDSEGNSLEIMYDGESDSCWVGIPDPEQNGVSGAIYLPEELEPLIRGLKPVIRVEDFPIFEFVPWEDDEEE